jgi:SAM-dependent methyltransferase
MQTGWADSDFFWTEFENQLFDAGRWRDVAREARQLATLLDLQPGQKILDLCCGPGRHLLGLARLGFDLTGLDRTMSYLETAARRALQDRLKVELIHADMRKFIRADAFDAVINMYNSFGYFEDHRDDRTVLANIFASLKPGGTLLMDMSGKEVLARNFKNTWHLHEGGARLVVHERICHDWTWREMKWVMTKNRRTYEYTSGHRIYCACEMKNELAATGFSQISVYGSLDATPYDQHARQMVIIAKKAR